MQHDIQTIVSAVMAALAADTAPTPTVAPVAPALTPGGRPAADPDAAANAFAAFRWGFGVPESVWRAQAPKGSDARAAIRAAYVGAFDRKAQKGQQGPAFAAFGGNVSAMQALAATLLASHGVAAPAQTIAAHVAGKAPQVPEAAPVMALTLPGIKAPEKAAKVQPAGTVALNACKVAAGSMGIARPTSGADADASMGGAYTAARDYVTTRRAEGHTVTAAEVAALIVAAFGR
jgi:hypothetical protein